MGLITWLQNVDIRLCNCHPLIRCLTLLRYIRLILKRNVRKSDRNPRFSDDTIEIIKPEVDQNGTELGSSCVQHSSQ